MSGNKSGMSVVTCSMTCADVRDMLQVVTYKSIVKIVTRHCFAHIPPCDLFSAMHMKCTSDANDYIDIQ